MASKLPIAISEDEFVKLIKNTKYEHWKVAFLLGFGAGMRISEIVGIQKPISKCCKADINIVREGKRHEKVQVKYCSRCKIKLEKEDIIRSETEWQMKPLDKTMIDFQERRISIKGAKGDKDRVVPVPKGLAPKHLKFFPMKCGARALQSAFTKTAKKAGLLEKKSDLHFHSLRHGFATQCVNNGMPIHHLRTLMGHSNISTTNIYLELNPKDALKSYQDLF